jgi:hypothetical protein
MQAMATITETQRASYRTVPDILRLVPRWPDPRSCCGVLFCVFENKDKCWEATNGVRSTYNDSLRSAIDEILDDTEDLLGQDARYRPFFCHSIYMVGRKEKRSNPVIFFCCEDAPLRIKARDVVKTSAIMRNYPAIRLGHASFPPEFNAPPRFAAQVQAIMDFENDSSISPDIREGIPSLPAELMRSALVPLGGQSRQRKGLSPKNADRPKRRFILASHRSSDKPTISGSSTISDTSVNQGLSSPAIAISPDPQETDPELASVVDEVQEPLLTVLSKTKDGREEGGDDFSRLVYWSRWALGLCGARIIVDGGRLNTMGFNATPDGAILRYEGIKMTVGVVILLDGKIYGVTAAHGLLEGYQPPEDKGKLVRSVDYDGESSESFEGCEYFSIAMSA